ncbi:unnamed protein product [Lampetra planeri]
MDTPTYGQILTQQKSKETPPCGQDPKGIFRHKRKDPEHWKPARPGGSTQERAATSGSARLIFSSTGRVDSGASCDQRVGSTHLQLDREGRLRSELRPAGRLDSSLARPGGSTQERAATSGSARLIFSSSGTQPSSIGSPEPALGARLKRLPISSAGGQDPLDSSTRPAWVNLCRVGGLCCRRSGDGRGLATRLRAHPGRRPNTARCERAVGATYRPGSELRQRINEHPNQFTTVTGERLIRMTRTAPSPHDHQASV